MRIDYARERLRAAAAALDEDGDLRDLLYAAYLKIHTLLPEHLPAGEFRARFSALHAALTKRHPGDPQETSVMDVARHLGDARAVAIAQELRLLSRDLDQFAPSAESPISTAGPISHETLVYKVRRRRPGGAAGRALVVFGSTEGHAQQVADVVAQELSGAGRQVTLTHAKAADAEAPLSDFELVFVVGSLHWSRYQSSVIAFVQKNRDALNAAPAALVSVSLAAAGVPQPDGLSLDACVEGLWEETLWTPDAVHHCGGRIRHTGYDYFRSLAVTLLCEKCAIELPPSRDLDLADYGALKRFVGDFAAAATARAAPI